MRLGGLPNDRMWWCDDRCVRSITLPMNMVRGFYTSQKDLPLAEKIGKFSPLVRYCTIGFERLTGRGLDNHKSTISAWIGVCCYNLNEVTFLLDLSVIWRKFLSWVCINPLVSIPFSGWLVKHKEFGSVRLKFSKMELRINFSGVLSDELDHNKFGKPLVGNRKV